MAKGCWGGGGRREGSLNRTHASFLNSLAGPEKRGENKRGEGNKRKYWCWGGGGGGRRGGGTEGLLNAGSALNATACAEILHSLLQSPLRDARAHAHARTHVLLVGAGVKGRRGGRAHNKLSTRRHERWLETVYAQKKREIATCQFLLPA